MHPIAAVLVTVEESSNSSASSPATRQRDHGWRDACGGDLAAASWLNALHGVLDRANDSVALRTIEVPYLDGLRDLSTRVAALEREAQDGNVDRAAFRERGDNIFADALLLLDGTG